MTGDRVRDWIIMIVNFIFKSQQCFLLDEFHNDESANQHWALIQNVVSITNNYYSLFECYIKGKPPVVILVYFKGKTVDMKC